MITYNLFNTSMNKSRILYTLRNVFLYHVQENAGNFNEPNILKVNIFWNPFSISIDFMLLGYVETWKMLLPTKYFNFKIFQQYISAYKAFNFIMH